MKLFIWIAGLLALGTFAWLDTMLPASAVYLRWSYPLILACFLALFRLVRGPSGADRAAALQIIAIIFVGFCGVLAAVTPWDIYIDIAIAWAIQSFIGALALAKYIEGKQFDD